MQTERLIYTDLVANNNKYWHAELDDTILRVNWGRVGDVSGQQKTFTFPSAEVAEKKFNSKVNSKLNKGYTRQQTVAVGRPVSVAYVAKVQIDHSNDKETEALIDFLVKRNIHAIEGTTSIRMEAGRLTTPLGPVTAEGLDEAQRLLNEMVKPKAQLDDLANLYLRIVPRNIGRRRIDADSLFGTAKQLEAEQAMVDSLRAVVKDLNQKATTQGPPVFQTKLEIVEANKADWAKIDKAFRSSLNRNHQSSKLKLHRIWRMQIESAITNFESQLGNVKRLWHGTKDANLLSILKNGFVIPSRRSSITITGRMFGDGIYFSDQSTKSLNYASGYWGGASQRCFMLFNDVAMGKEYMAKHSFSGTPPRGYDSTFAKGGQAGVMNNELIVYRATQVNPQFLCEFR